VLFERSIFTVAVLAALAFVAAGVDAYLATSVEGELGHHVLLTLGAALLVVFPHLWTVFYLLTTGRAVRLEVEEKRASPRVLSRTRRNRRRALPPALLTAAAALATVMLGQQALVGPRPWLHPAAFFLALALQLWALWAERRSLWDNAALLAELDAKARATGAAAPAATPLP
jgi:hypothetical protein